MSELTVLALKIGYLALLWLFILFTGNVIRTDLFGRKVSSEELTQVHAAATGAEPAQRPSRKERAAARKLPKTLKVLHGRQAGMTVPLGEGVAIGRAPDCELILDDDYVSTRHARIVRTAEGWAVEDLGSTNGTFVNNERIAAQTPFGIGDTLRIGRTLMSVEK